VIQGLENVLICRALSRGQKARITIPPEVIVSNNIMTRSTSETIYYYCVHS
jgi:hypothetical protein